MNILQQGEQFVHVVLSTVGQGVTRILAIHPQGATLHSLDAAGQVASQVLNLPALREILALVDQLTPQQPQQ